MVRRVRQSFSPIPWREVLVFFSVSLCLCGSLLRAQNTTEATKNYHNENQRMEVSFAKQIAPIFQAKCVGCHSKAANMGGFVLSDFESLMKGGQPR